MECRTEEGAGAHKLSLQVERATILACFLPRLGGFWWSGISGSGMPSVIANCMPSGTLA